MVNKIWSFVLYLHIFEVRNDAFKVQFFSGLYFALEVQAPPPPPKKKKKMEEEKVKRIDLYAYKQ